MPQLKDLNIRLTGNNKDFTSSMQKAEKRLKKFGKSMANVGKKMSMALTLPIVGLAVKSAQAFDTQELAVQKLSAQIKQSGQDISSILPKYQKFAAKLQDLTIVGDEVTLGLIQMAMTMGSDAPDKAAQNAIALSKALGVDLNSAIKMVTLAEKGEFTMLNRYVPALRATENEAEKLAITTQLYADGLAIAKAEALNGLGPLKQLKNTFGDLLEEIGKLIVENDTFKNSIQGLKTRFEGLITRFQEMTPQTKKIIVTIAAVVAAIGPLIAIIGALTMAMGFLAANPVVLAIAAIVIAVAAITVVLIKLSKRLGGFKNLWILFKEIATAALNTVWNYIKAFGQSMKAFAGLLLKVLGFPWFALFEIVKKVLSNIGEAFKLLLQGKVKEAMAVIGSDIKEGFENSINSIKQSFTGMGKPFKDAAAANKELWDGVKKTTEAFKEEAKAAKETEDALATNKVEVDKLAKSADGLATKLKGAKIQSLGLALVVSTELPQGAKVATEGFKPMIEQYREMRKQTIDFTETIKAGIQDLIVTVAEGIGEMAAALIRGGEVDIKNFGQNILESVAGFAKNLGTLMITTGLAEIAFKALGGNPVGLIIAGAALIAAASATTALISTSSAGMGAVGAGSGSGGAYHKRTNYSQGIGNLKVANAQTTYMRGSDIYASNLKATIKNGRVR